MIVEKVIELKESRIKQYPVKSNRASQLGHECTRYLVFERTKWQEKKLHDVGLQQIFDEGNIHEKAVLRDLEDAGFTIIEQQKSFDWPLYNVTGHIDGKVLIEDSAVPIEIKSSSPFVWQSLSDAQSLYKHKYHHVRMYPSQITAYLLMDEKPYGLFIFKNKTSGQLKEIRMELDYELGEKLLQKAEAINKHVEEGTIPDCMPYDDDICGSCGYLQICLPDVKRDALELQTDPEMEMSLERYEELKPLKKEYDALDREIKKAFKEQEKVMVGSWLITGKWIEKKSFTVAASKYWSTKINRIMED